MVKKSSKSTGRKRKRVMTKPQHPVPQNRGRSIISSAKPEIAKVYTITDYITSDVGTTGWHGRNGYATLSLFPQALIDAPKYENFRMTKIKKTIVATQLNTSLAAYRVTGMTTPDYNDSLVMLSPHINPEMRDALGFTETKHPVHPFGLNSSGNAMQKMEFSWAPVVDSGTLVTKTSDWINTSLTATRFFGKKFGFFVADGPLSVENFVYEMKTEITVEYRGYKGGITV